MAVVLQFTLGALVVSSLVTVGSSDKPSAPDRCTGNTEYWTKDGLGDSSGPWLNANITDCLMEMRNNVCNYRTHTIRDNTIYYTALYYATPHWTISS